MQALKIFMILCVLISAAVYERVVSVPRIQLAGRADEFTAAGKQALNTWEGYAAHYKEELRQRTRNMADSFSQQIERLRDKTKEVREETKEKFNQAAGEWHEQRERLEEKLKEINAKTAEAWAAAKKRIDERIEELRALYDRSRSASS